MTHWVKRVNFGVAVFAAIALFLCTSFNAPVEAAINPQINFQGKITNPDGTNVANGNYSIRFRIYTDPTAEAATACGTTICRWEENQTTVTVTDGIFQVALGSVTALPGSVDFNNANIYLGVKVGTDAEMTPRIRFTASPYAFNSERVGGLAVTSLAQVASTNTFTAINIFQGTDPNLFTVQNTGGQKLLTANTSSQKVIIGPDAIVGGGRLSIGTDTTDAAGGLSFGSDGNLYRSGANELSTDDSFKVKGTSLAIGTGTGIGTLSTWNGGNAFWIDMPTTGPSGIGSGGPGANAWIALAQGAGNYFTDALAGDIAYRNQGGRLLFGVTAGLSNMAISSNRIQIGQATTDATAVLLTLDTYNQATDPAGTVGSTYYNTNLGKFRCYEGTAWKNCITAELAARSFLDTTSDTHTIANNTTAYWDPAAQNNNTYPNITPSRNTKSIWVNFSVEFRSSSAADVEFVARIERSTTTNVAACGSGTTIGYVGTFTTNTNTRKSSSIQIMDSPATTNKVWYNVCSDTNGTTAGTVNQITATLFEVDSTNN